MGTSERMWFYGSPAWKQTRNAYFKAKGGLCERCLASGVIKAGEFVHHKIHLDNVNIHDSNIALSWDNLEVLCRDCHAAEHGKKRYYVSADGVVHTKREAPL